MEDVTGELVFADNDVDEHGQFENLEAFRSRVIWTCVFMLAKLKERGAGAVAGAAKKVREEAVGGAGKGRWEIQSQ